MRQRIDPLIAERAPWLFLDRPTSRIARGILERLLRYPETLEVARTLSNKPALAIMDDIAAKLARHVTVTGIDRIPAQGAALLLANHPTGIADGIILHHVLRQRRADAYFFANHDILRVLPQMSEVIAPVEWRVEKRTHTRMRETMAYATRAAAAGRLGVIFPSGRLARRRGLRLVERPWMASASMLARKFDLPVIPVHIEARNSTLFYLFDLIHPTLRDISLFHETLNKDRFSFGITVGEAIPARTIPPRAGDGIAFLHDATLALGREHGRPGQPLVKHPLFSRHRTPSNPGSDAGDWRVDPRRRVASL